MSDISDLRFFQTPEHECSYLPEKMATTVFVDPTTALTTRQYGLLSRAGFRRSGMHVYRPHCARCKACVPIRVPVDKFQPRRGQRRVERRNQDLIQVLQPAEFSPDNYALYETYIAARHADGDMFPASEEQFRSFLVDSTMTTRFLSFYAPTAPTAPSTPAASASGAEDASTRLIGVAVFDVLEDGLSAVYTFFDPEESARSIGSYAILAQINIARSLGLPYLYLGYWIEQSDKMRYKRDYRPAQVLQDNAWQTLVLPNSTGAAKDGNQPK